MNKVYIIAALFFGANAIKIPNDDRFGTNEHQTNWHTPAQRGEVQWDAYANRHINTPLEKTGETAWKHDHDDRRPYNGAAQFVQVEAEGVRGEKQW